MGSIIILIGYGIKRLIKEVRHAVKEKKAAAAIVNEEVPLTDSQGLWIQMPIEEVEANV